MYSVNLYLKRWNEGEVMAAVSVLRNLNTINLAITDTVIKNRVLKCGPTSRQLFYPESYWMECLNTIHDLIDKFDRMRSIMSVVSSELDTLTDIEHSILCIDPIETPQFKYSLSFTMSSHQII
jgi:hypothetical protein